MEPYCHINRNEDCNWKVGDEFEFGEDENYLWKSLANKRNTFELNGEKYDAYQVIKAAFEAYIGTASPPSIMEGYHFTGTKRSREFGLSKLCISHRDLTQNPDIG